MPSLALSHTSSGTLVDPSFFQLLYWDMMTWRAVIRQSLRDGAADTDQVHDVRGGGGGGAS